VKSFLKIEKWTKINVQKCKKNIVLLTKNFDLIKKIYRYKINVNEKIYGRKFFIFFAEKYLGTFLVSMYGTE